MRPVALIRTLVEADAVRAGSGTSSSRLFVCIEVEAADEGGVVVEAGECIVGWLVEWRCFSISTLSRLPHV